MTHPYVLDALTAWHALDDASAWIAPTIQAEAESGRAGRFARPLTAAVIARRGELYEAARHQDQTARWATRGLTDTSKALGTMRSPIREELLDAPAIVNRATVELEALLEEAAAERDEGVRLRVGDALRWQTLAGALADLDPWRAQTASAGLWRAEEVLRGICGSRPPHEPYEGACPRCDTYGLVWEKYATDPAEWTVLCDRGCWCAGERCPCGIAERVRGTTHRWEPAIMAPTSIGAVSFEQAIEEMQAAWTS